MKRALALMALLAAAPVPALAATGSADCIAARLGSVALQHIGDDVVEQLDHGGSAARALDADRAALLAARAACRSSNGWSAAALVAATNYAQARAARMGAEAALRRDGVDSAPLAFAFTRLMPADRRSYLDRMTPAAAAVVDRASADKAVRRHAWMLLAALAGLESGTADFAVA